MKIQGFVYAVLFIAAGIIFAGCEEDPTDVGIGVQPGDEELGVFTSDTITIEAHSMLADSIRTDETEFSLIGSHYDPVFGVTTASVFTSFALSAADHDFGENATPDLPGAHVAIRHLYRRYRHPTVVSCLSADGRSVCRFIVLLEPANRL
ncbi:MAG: DUF4270 family protein [Bacteroidales bacterium]|nr:DUF4270 family protein [Bacteroidales bacterium]